MIAGFKCFSTNVAIQFCNRNCVIGSIHNAMPNFSKTIQFVFGKQNSFQLLCKNDHKTYHWPDLNASPVGEAVI